MKCFYHPEIEAVAICKNCHKAICKDCLVEVQNGVACKDSINNCVTEVERLNRFLERSKIMAERTSTSFSRTIMFVGFLGLFFFLKLPDFVAKVDSPAWRQKQANFLANCHDRQNH